MTAIVPIQRIRLELDRTVRERSFFARVIGARIEEPAYGDLLVQLSGLVDAFADERGPRHVAPRFKATARARAIRLEVAHAICAPAALFRETARCYSSVLTVAFTTEIGLTILGTSWLEDASVRLAARSRLDPAYLRALLAAGRSAYDRVQERFGSSSLDIDHVYGFAELVRGAALGVGAYLESTWPAPVARARAH